MESPLYVLLSQQDTLDRYMAVTAQNIANVNTTGYKGSDVVFEDLVRQPDPKFTHHMVVDRASYRNVAQGPLLKTDNPLDIAVTGQGYFAVETPQGVQYTRNGSFQMNPDGALVTSEGFPLLSGGGAQITIPREAQKISISADGTISTEQGTVGRLQVLKFANEQSLKQTYGGFYSTESEAEVDPDSRLQQGFVEQSNVKPVVEMTKVIEISRTYQRVARLIDAEHERMRAAIRQLGRVS